VPDRGSAVYAAYISAQATAEDARKDSIEKRGLAVITTSGTIVSLLFGLVAVLTGVEKYVLPDGAESWLYAALAAFVVACVAGIGANAPLKYEAVLPDSLRSALQGRWGDTPDEAEKMVALTELKVLAKARRVNTIKAIILIVGVIAEVLAILFLALGVRIVILE
jgi:hypothetical protein